MDTLIPEYTKREIVLKRIKQVALQYLSNELVDDVDVFDDLFTGHVVLRAMRTMLAKKAGDRIIRYPDGWKEAVKERWLPQWLKKRFPIRFKEFDALVIYPNLLKEFPVPGELRGTNYYLTFAECGKIMPPEEE